jgi:hypothetical protein
VRKRKHLDKATRELNETTIASESKIGRTADCRHGPVVWKCLRMMFSGDVGLVLSEASRSTFAAFIHYQKRKANMTKMKDRLNEVGVLTRRLQRDFPNETAGFLNFIKGV